jgi:GNAT superfamily N-acetyltransferase
MNDYQFNVVGNDDVRTIQIVSGNESLGMATLVKQDHSIYQNYYDLKSFMVPLGFQGQGFGSKLLREVENFISSLEGSISAVDAIQEGNPAKRIWQSHGWQALDDLYPKQLFWGEILRGGKRPLVELLPQEQLLGGIRK